MPQQTAEQTIESITHSHDVVQASDDLVSSRYKTVTKYSAAILIVTLIVLSVFLFLSPVQLLAFQESLHSQHYLFYWMVLVGFIAELVAGSMGMGYGVICTTILLILNIPPAVISASIHSAESFTSAAGTVSHWQLGNINKKLVKSLAIPAVIGAVLGALALTYLGERYATMTKPFIALYAMYLGIRILLNAFKKKEKTASPKAVNIKSLGLIGGFIDSFGGGGWGPLVTGTFIRNGHTPRFVIGSSTMAKFILTVASAITFIFTIGIQHWNIVAGLLIGGITTAPFSAMLTSRLPARVMFIAVGVVVIICSLITLLRAIFL
jgi:uncharacterized protein